MLSDHMVVKFTISVGASVDLCLDKGFRAQAHAEGTAYFFIALHAHVFCS